jgi:hypothetical protein
MTTGKSNLKWAYLVQSAISISLLLFLDGLLTALLLGTFQNYRLSTLVAYFSVAAFIFVTAARLLPRHVQ